MEQKRVYFKNLDSIRFIAAFMVFLDHSMNMPFRDLLVDEPFLQRFFMTISNGHAGVSIFFVLSGFLITYLLMAEYEVNGSISLKGFYIRRILRIWPLYYAIVVFTFFLYPYLKGLLGIPYPIKSNVLYYLTFLSNFDVIHVYAYFPGQFAASQNVTWSVSVEEQFYLFWPLLFTFLPKRAWIYAISFVIIASISFRITNYNDARIGYYHTLSVLMDLGIGGLFAYLIRTHLRIRAFWESASTATHITLFVVSFSLLLWEDQIFAFKYGYALGRVFMTLSFAMIIAAQAMTKKDSILNLGRISFADKWGKYTYGIYLIHTSVLTVMDALRRVVHYRIDDFPHIICFTVVVFILTLFVSWLSYEYFESKLLNLKQKFEVIKTNP